MGDSFLPFQTQGYDCPYISYLLLYNKIPPKLGVGGAHLQSRARGIAPGKLRQEECEAQASVGYYSEMLSNKKGSPDLTAYDSKQ